MLNADLDDDGGSGGREEQLSFLPQSTLSMRIRLSKAYLLLNVLMLGAVLFLLFWVFAHHTDPNSHFLRGVEYVVLAAVLFDLATKLRFHGWRRALFRAPRSFSCSVNWANLVLSCTCVGALIVSSVAQEQEGEQLTLVLLALRCVFYSLFILREARRSVAMQGGMRRVLDFADPGGGGGGGIGGIGGGIGGGGGGSVGVGGAGGASNRQRWDVGGESFLDSSDDDEEAPRGAGGGLLTRQQQQYVAPRPPAQQPATIEE